MPSVEDLEGTGVLATAHAHLLTGPGEVELALTCADGTSQARRTRGIRPTLRACLDT